MAKKIVDPDIVFSRKDLLSSGSTTLNLACSGSPFGAFLKGMYYFFVGDSTSGKTFLTMSCCAEASTNKHFKDYRFIVDQPERGCLMNVSKLFGSEVNKRLEPPAWEKDGKLKRPVFSTTIEEFYFHVDDAVKQGKPFIYILDSMDCLSSEAEFDKFEEKKNAYRAGKTVSGSYGDGKAKKNSEGLRKVLSGIERTGSILIIISQTRDNLGPGYKAKTRAGGHALRFYSTVELWSSVAGKIKKTIKGKDRTIGTSVKVKVEKNRLTGKLHEIFMDIYPSYGIDDIGSCIDYLIAEKWWNKTKGKQTFEAKEFKFSGTREKLIQKIEEEGLVKDLQSLVGQCWTEIEEDCALKRKSKYD